MVRWQLCEGEVISTGDKREGSAHRVINLALARIIIIQGLKR
jgi:hypothetical protein